MTLSTTIRRNLYSGDDVTLNFPYNYRIFADENLVVILTDASSVDTTLTLDTHYSVTGEGDATGGTVTLVTAPATGETLTIYRSITQTQTTDLLTQGPFSAVVHEDVFDRVVMMVQENAEEIGRAVKVDITSSDDPDDYLTNVNTAVTDAQTARTGAETAETNAETAQAAAELARDEAEAAGGITAHVTAYHRSLRVDDTDSPVTGVEGKTYAVDCSSAAVTITLPASPALGDKIGVYDRGGDASTNNITVGRNGKNIKGAAEDYIIDLAYGNVTFDYNGTDWQLYIYYPAS